MDPNLITVSCVLWCMLVLIWMISADDHEDERRAAKQPRRSSGRHHASSGGSSEDEMASEGEPSSRHPARGSQVAELARCGRQKLVRTASCCCFAPSCACPKELRTCTAAGSYGPSGTLRAEACTSASVWVTELLELHMLW